MDPDVISPVRPAAATSSATAIVRSLYYVITVELLRAELPGMKRTLGRGCGCGWGGRGRKRGRGRGSFHSSRFRLTIPSFGRQLFTTLPRNESYVKCAKGGRSVPTWRERASGPNCAFINTRQWLEKHCWMTPRWSSPSHVPLPHINVKSGTRAEDWNDFQSPLSRIPLTFCAPFAASFDLWPPRARPSLRMCR